MQTLNYPGQGAVHIVPSASGTKLFTTGAGDDLSGWKVVDVQMIIKARKFIDIFTDHEVERALITRSAPGERLPLLPAASATSPARFGTDIGVVDFDVSFTIRRLWQYYSLNAVLPVVISTSIAFLTFFISPDNIDTRLQLVSWFACNPGRRTPCHSTPGPRAPCHGMPAVRRPAVARPPPVAPHSSSP